jgi:hypothetical protein
MHSPSSAERPSLCQVVLGLFVAVQLVYLLVSNALNVFGSPSLPIFRDRELVARLQMPTNKWAEWTYQFQGWTQYAPHVNHQSGFVCLTLRWPDEPSRAPVQLLSDVEPVDPDHFTRGFLDYRVAVYESWLSGPYWAWDPATASDQKERWREHLVDNFRKERHLYRDYMLWRWWRYQAALPQDQRSRAPVEITFSVRIYALSPPGKRPWKWRGPIDVPVTRLRLKEPVARESAPLPTELYDPFEERFMEVSMGGAPQ